MKPRKGLWAVQCLLLTILCSCLVSFADAQLNFTLSEPSGTYSSISGSSGVTKILNANADESLSGLVNIGFNFQYGCSVYTQLRVCSNGYISLGYNTLVNIAANDLSTVGAGPILAPLWDDLATSSSGAAYSLLSGTAPNRVLTIEWRKMDWDHTASSSSATISFQVKLYETTNVIDFIYNQEGGSTSKTANSGGASIGINGGYSATDFYSLNSSGTSPTASYGTQTSNITTEPATNQVYEWTPQNMAYSSASVISASTGNISKCNNLNQAILCVKVVTTGCTNPISVSSFVFNMNGSTIPGTNINDVDSIHIYYTANANGFAAVMPFSGKGIKPTTGNMTLTGSQTLVAGINYFWIAYDINPASATVNHVVDAQMGTVTVNGSAKTPSAVTADTSGNRKIVSCSAAPGGITNPSFWVEGSAGTSSTTDGASISTWSDQSGNGRDASQSTTANQPTFRNNSTDNINFNPTVNFNANSQTASSASFMPIPSNGVLSTGNNPYEVYAVLKPGTGNASTPGKFLFAGTTINGFNAFDVRNGSVYMDTWDLNDLQVSNAWSANNPSMVTFDFNSVQRNLILYGLTFASLVGNNRYSPDLNDALGCQYVASPHLEFYDGGIGEIITYANTSHDQLTRNKVETYLGIKYGMTLLHDYVDSYGDTVWKRAKNTSYDLNIIGLGLDNNASLNQKQSKSTSTTADVLTMYLGTTKQVSQASNTGSFPGTDTSFFIAGSNGLALAFSSTITDVPAGVCCRLQRAWLSQKKNFNSGNITMEWDLSSIGAGNTPLFVPDLRLLVDNDGVFANATVLQPTFTVSGEVVTAVIPASSFTTAQPYFTLGSVANSTPLALSIQSFTAVCRNKNIQTSWVIGQTTDNISFTIERSNNGGVFSPVGQIEGGVSGNLSYSWTDESPLPGTSSYRLKVTDNTDNNVIYSTIAVVSGCSIGNSVVIGSDPASGKSVMASIQLQQNSLVDIGFYDLLGQRIDMPGLTGRRSLMQGVANLSIPQVGLATGIYILTVTIDGDRQVYRVKE